MSVTLIAPWLGRTALTWIVDMSSTGVSIAYFITCLSAARLFSFDKSSNTYGPVYKVFAILGSIVSFVFLLLLLVPGSPAALSTPSYIALGGWLIIGLIFFVVRYPKLKNMDNDRLSKLILNQSEDEIVDLINKNKSDKANT